MRTCPECDADMELQEADPDVGIESSFYFCTECEHTELAEDIDDD